MRKAAVQCCSATLCNALNGSSVRCKRRRAGGGGGCHCCWCNAGKFAQVGAGDCARACSASCQPAIRRYHHLPAPARRPSAPPRARAMQARSPCRTNGAAHSPLPSARPLPTCSQPLRAPLFAAACRYRSLPPARSLCAAPAGFSQWRPGGAAGRSTP